MLSNPSVVVQFPRLRAGTFIEAWSENTRTVELTAGFPRLRAGTFIEANTDEAAATLALRISPP